MKVKNAPSGWSQSTTRTECTLHQLSPYIGKLKSKIAKDLIEQYSKVGDLIFDPFSGSGTVPLEALINNRRALASDISPYSKILTIAKLFPPTTPEEAFEKTDKLLARAQKLKSPDLRKVPIWVRKFFHPETLRDAINFSNLCRKTGNEFIFACFLGILHHQRPGFLSYPSSHLVPYLRTNNFPKQNYPDLYEYRDLGPRLRAKILRALSRTNELHLKNKKSSPAFYCKSVEKLKIDKNFDCLITSPPYMNALDYIRDNRLRLWFIDPNKFSKIRKEPTANFESFDKQINSLSKLMESRLKPKGHGILIVGEQIGTRKRFNLSDYILNKVAHNCPSIKLTENIRDIIPDIRRSRRDCKGTKTENIFIFKKR